MSDISFSFSGIVLLGVIALTAALYALIALVSLLAAAFRTVKGRALRLAGAAGSMALASLLATALVFPDFNDGTFPDWIDYLALPWILLAAAGCWLLTRLR